MYINRLIIRKPDEVDDTGNVLTVKYSCGQRGCHAYWLVKADFTTTTNYRRHYQRHHKKISIDGLPNEDTSLLARRTRTLADF
jgi:hypothetical protein